ncbi:hypothetical protein A4A49_17264 [Nicotiana attenuata]|uniref:DUF4216 domain-containing protein n=1 Tax=Nicotiana attenuata TaxID=49451 RepID=A0A314KRM6_NICAT|nr:hypothetical protein A4A49_17264 [Nicotiana attenuata]
MYDICGSTKICREFARIHVDSTQHLSDTEWNRQFIEWFKDRVAQSYKEDDSQIMEDLLALSRGPTQYVLHYNGYIVNEYRFHVEDYDKHLRTQNCGVIVVGETDEHSENIDYYGVLTDVLELQFTRIRVNLFQCNWFDAYNKKKGIKTDEYDIFDMRPSKNENEVASIRKDTTKYAFVAPGKGRGQELRSMCSLEESENEERSFHQNTHYNCQSMSRPSKSTLSAAQELRTVNKSPLVYDKENMHTDISFSPFVDQVMQSTQKVETSALGKGGRELRSMCSFEEYENEERSFHPNSHYACRSMSRPSKSARLDSIMSAAQGLRTINKNPLVHDKENMQTDIPFSPSIDQAMQSTQKAETSILGKGRGREKSMCSFEESENEERSFHQNSHYASQNMSRPSKSTRLDSNMFAAQGLRTNESKPFGS